MEERRMDSFSTSLYTILGRRAAEGNPLKIGLVGAGFFGRALANHLVNAAPGMSLSVICNRTLGNAQRAYREAGRDDARTVSTVGELEDCIAHGVPAITDDTDVICGAEGLEVLIEATGAVGFAAQFAVKAIESRHHLVTMTAELDGTVGPILKRKADNAGVVLTAGDGDQPGVLMNLFRFVKSIGMEPLVCGNIKGLQDPYRTPTTQAGFAAQWGQSPAMVTGFADGTKISFEQAIVANGTGMCVEQRGMRGGDFEGHVDDLCRAGRYDIEKLRALGGVVDYVVKTRPSPGVFVLATTDDPKQRKMLNYYKLGDGPLYSFYTPYHLCHMEVPLSAARAACLHDATLAPIGRPYVEVIATAKKALREGERLDGPGGYCCYGQCENRETVLKERLLPMGLIEGCVVRRDVPRDQVLTYDDVRFPPSRVIDRLRDELDATFPLGDK
jgi:predicted homoserine dehydrogenase-like protein